MALMDLLGLPDGDQTVAKRHQSNALWPDDVRLGGYDGVYGNISTDTHQTREQAEAVCAALERDGLGGDRKRFPLRTWVSGIERPPRMPANAALTRRP